MLRLFESAALNMFKLHRRNPIVILTRVSTNLIISIFNRKPGTIGLMIMVSQSTIMVCSVGAVWNEGPK